MSRRTSIETTERNFVGALLLRPGEADAIVGLVSNDDFENVACRTLYVAMARIFDRGESTGDIAAIERQLVAQGALNLVGGLEGVGRFADVPHWAVINPERLARAIREAASARRVRDACASVCDAYADASEDPQAWVDEQAARLGSVLDGRTAGDVPLLRDQSHELFRATTEGKARGLLTGLHELDKLTGGLQPGEIIVLGARTSHGKTALAHTFALRSKVPTIVFTLEMPNKQVYPRLLAAVSDVDLSRIVHRKLDSTHRAALVRAREAIDHLPLALLDRRGVSVNDIRMQTRSFLRHHGRRGETLCIVDYVQLVRPSKERSSREQEVADVSRGLQALAGELDIPVLVLSQINRGIETRAVKEPTLADLRESGSLEQDARAVFLLWRPELWWDDETKQRRKDELGLATLMVAKQSNGPTGSVTLRYHGKFTRFDNVETDALT